MSRIFDAVTNTPGDVQQIALSVLANAGAMPATEDPAATPEEPVEAAQAWDEPRRTADAHVSNRTEYQQRQDVRVCKIAPCTGAATLANGNIDSAALEQYRLIRTRITQHARQPKTIAVSSAGPGDGKTMTAINLALTLAMRRGDTVLLVDTDLRRSDLAASLGLPAEPGVTDLLRRGCDWRESVIQLEDVPNLYVLPAGRKCSRPAELLDSPRWRDIVNGIRDSFDYAIFDTPPVGAVADYDLVQAVVDGLVMVIRPDHTQGSACRKALDLVPSEKMLGVVINCAYDWVFWRSHQTYRGTYGTEGR